VLGLRPVRRSAARASAPGHVRGGRQRVLETWRAGAGEGSAIVPFLRGMQENTEDLGDAVAAAKAHFHSGLYYSQAFRTLLPFRDLVPDASSTEEWQTLRARHLEVAEEELDNWRDIGDLDEIDEIERYARRMGVELDSDRVRRTREDVEQAIEEAEGRAREAAEEHEPPEESDEPDDEKLADAEIEAMFARLADG
jgi:hypothetical protein